MFCILAGPSHDFRCEDRGGYWAGHIVDGTGGRWRWDLGEYGEYRENGERKSLVKKGKLEGVKCGIVR